MRGTSGSYSLVSHTRSVSLVRVLCRSFSIRTCTSAPCCRMRATCSMCPRRAMHVLAMEFSTQPYPRWARLDAYIVAGACQGG